MSEESILCNSSKLYSKMDSFSQYDKPSKVMKVLSSMRNLVKVSREAYTSFSNIAAYAGIKVGIDRDVNAIYVRNEFGPLAAVPLFNGVSAIAFSYNCDDKKQFETLCGKLKNAGLDVQTIDSRFD